MLSIPMEEVMEPKKGVLEPQEANKSDAHMNSAAAFVEGGIQDACDDACSICLEYFSNSDPSTVTSCRHEFHLQCILEWGQRSSQCPMCCQAIILKDQTSQELFEAVEQERNFRANTTRSSTVFRHPLLGDIELPNLPAGATEADLEERLLQHLAAAAAMRRAQHHVSRREGHRVRSFSQAHPRFLAFSAPRGTVSSSAVNDSHERELLSVSRDRAPVSLVNNTGDEEQFRSTIPAQTSGPNRTPSESQDREGASDFQSFSESLRSRLSSVSMRYRESIARSTRGWKERLFSRSSSVADIGSEVRREVNAGIASVSLIMDRVDSRNQNRTSEASVTDSAPEQASNTEQQNQTIVESLGERRSMSASHAATSVSD